MHSGGDSIAGVLPAQIEDSRHLVVGGIDARVEVMPISRYRLQVRGRLRICRR